MKFLELPQWLLLFFTVTLVSLVLQNPAWARPDSISAPTHVTLQFEPPTPGSYRLPGLGAAADGKVLDTDGNAVRLHELMGDKLVLLSFIYSTCSDINGCPLATAVFHKIKNRLQKDHDLAGKLRLLTLSFNPEHDTPEAMKRYGAGLTTERVDWRFLTARSEQTLAPILAGYGQSIQKIHDAQGRYTGTFSHVLRVFLIDKNKQLRNSYSVSYLDPDTLINDIKTLALEETARPASAAKLTAAPPRWGAGDNKTAYESSRYQTDSAALTDRTGRATDLLKTIRKPPLGLPAVPVPADNAVTAKKIALGRKLFYDRRLSLNNTFSCAMCHIPEQGFTSTEMATAVGVEGRTVRRNSPALYNVAFAQILFHDGRETTLEQQVWAPLLAHNEMANPSIGYVIDKINANVDYRGLFEQAFGKRTSMETVGMALASYERTLNSANSAFDRWYYRKDKTALSTEAQRGFKLFSGKAQCARCHTVAPDYALFTDNGLHNTGIGFAEAMHQAPDKTSGKQRVQLAPGLFAEVESALVGAVSEPAPNDLGRYEVTQKPEDRWKYKTPSLRNISLTAPYMHNGSLADLRQVIEFYNRGGHANENLDPLLKPLNLTRGEKDDLRAFLEALTGDNVAELVADAYAAPIGDAE